MCCLYVLIKQKISNFIPHKPKPFWQLSQLNDSAINAIANLFVHERLKIPEVYSECSQVFKMELFAKIVNSKTSFTVIAKSFILDVRMGSEYTSTFSL